MGMAIDEVIKWLTIMKANLNSFPEVSNAKKIEALGEAIRLLKNEQSEDKIDCEHTECRNCINHKYCDYEKSSSGFPNKSEIPTSLDCVSREKVWFMITGGKYSNESDEQFIDRLVNKLAELSSVTPIRPKGHWIETAEEYYKAINEKGGGVNENTDYFVDDIACSECLAKFSVIDNEAERFDFCPACGADMRGEE